MLSPTIFAPLIKKLPNPLYKWLGRRYIDGNFPRHIFIETTTRCQLSCAYCPRPKISHNISFGLFEKIVDEASLHGHRSFSLHLFGEPLLYPRIIESIEYLKRRGHTVILTTNGILLGKYGAHLKRVDKIIWSYKEGIEIPEEIKTWDNFTVRFFGKSEGKWKHTEIRDYHNYGGQVSTAQFTGIRWPCYHPFLAPAVRWNGDMVICCADPMGKSAVGNVWRMTVKEGWKRMQDIREEHLKGIYSGICKDCDVWKSYPSLF